MDAMAPSGVVVRGGQSLSVCQCEVKATVLGLAEECNMIGLVLTVPFRQCAGGTAGVPAGSAMVLGCDTFLPLSPCQHLMGFERV